MTTDPSFDLIETAAHVAGLAEYDYGMGATSYLHGNLIGTTEAVSDQLSAVSNRTVYTAFGEPISGTPATRYSYAGEWGYQAADSADPLSTLGWLHVGHRYYDPSTGRFLQRDPLGVTAGLNVYAYVESSPIVAIDPSGLCHFCDMEVSPTDGGKIDWTSGEVGATASKLLVHGHTLFCGFWVRMADSSMVRMRSLEIMEDRDGHSEQEVYRASGSGGTRITQEAGAER